MRAARQMSTVNGSVSGYGFQP